MSRETEKKVAACILGATVVAFVLGWFVLLVFVPKVALILLAAVFAIAIITAISWAVIVWTEY